MNIQLIFGINVRRFRDALGWSQDYLAEVSGLHRTYISGIERGVRNPSIKIAHKIAVALKVKVSQLFEHDGSII
jgi:transcriptional regulator with XRE-family HTH domain